MENLELYKELIGLILKGKVMAFGVLAVDKANGVEGLKVDDGGAVVSLSGDPISIIQQLLSTFELIAGKTSTISTRTFTMSFVREHPELKLPSDLVS